MILGKKPFEKTVEKGENAGNPAFSCFPTVFSTLTKTKIIVFSTSILSSANAFNLDQSKILSFAKKLKNPSVLVTHSFQQTREVT